MDLRGNPKKGSEKPKLGIIHPIMGMKKLLATTATSLADALFPRVRQRVLAVFFSTPDRSFYANEVIALAQSGPGAVQRELASGLLCQLPVQELPLQRSWCLVSQRGRQLSPVARAFADFIQQRRDVLAALEQRFNA